MYYTTICAIIKDEHPDDLHEWLLYHFAIGFEHILIYDNNSKIPLKNTLREFIENRLVTVIDFPLTKAQQLSAYIHALKEWANRTVWMGFIDLDEFIVPLERSDIRDFLDPYVQYGGLGANWTMFGSNNHISRPNGGIIQNYTQSLGPAGHIKSIVRPSVTKRPISAHHFIFEDNYYCVNEDEIPILNFHTYPLANKIRINHYYYKSQQDWEAKMERGLVTQMRGNVERKMDNFYSHLAQPYEFDDKILRFQPLMHKLGQFTIKNLASFVQEDSNLSLETGHTRVNDLIRKRDYENAHNLLARMKRYGKNFELLLLEANLLFLKDRFEEGVKILSREMTMPGRSEHEIKLCYQSIANYYAASGKKEIANNIHEYLG